MARKKKRVYHVKVNYPNIGPYGRDMGFNILASSTLEARKKFRKTILHRPVRILRVSIQRDVRGRRKKKRSSPRHIHF